MMDFQTVPNIQVAALTGGLKNAAARFRVRQYIPMLQAKNICVTEHIPYWGESCGLPSPFKIAARVPALFRSRKADIIWISRDLVQGYETFERCLKRPRIMDVDDAIWLNWPLGRRCQPHIAKGMDAIVTGNDYLARYYSKYCRDVYILPTAIDTARYMPRPAGSGRPEGKFVIGWTGLASNYKFLRPVEPALRQFFDQYRDTELLVLSNRPYESELLPADRIRYIPWTPENEAVTLHQMSVGIMPLPDDPWTRGKCSFKMLQYMASALPVVASPVGMNKQVFEKGDCGFCAISQQQWVEALEALYTDSALAEKKANAGRAIIEEHYTADCVAAQWAEIFRKYAP